MTDLRDRALSHLPSQFENATRIRNTISAVVGAISEASDTFTDLKTERWVSSAIGKQLDGAGSIVWEAREGRGDEEYRRAIMFRIFANTTQATPPYVIRGLKFLTSPDDAQYIEMRPATAILYTNGMSVPSDIAQAMEEIGPAAISDIPVIVSYGTHPLRLGEINQNADFYVNHDLLEVDNSTLLVTSPQVAAGNSATLGGIVPAYLDLGGGTFLDTGDGSRLTVYDPDFAVLYGTDIMPGVFI